MVYRKNLPMFERVARTLGGAALIAYGLFGMKGLPFGYALAASGAALMLMGLAGYCPMCALAGRCAAPDAEKRR